MTHPPHQEPEKGETRKLAEDVMREWWKEDHLPLVVLIDNALQSAAQAARKEALEWAAQMAEAHKHIGPFDWNIVDERIPAYSNGTCDHIARAIRRGPDPAIGFPPLASPPQSKER